MSLKGEPGSEPLHIADPAALDTNVSRYYPCVDCRGTSLIRNSAPLKPYSRTMIRALR